MGLEDMQQYSVENWKFEKKEFIKISMQSLALLVQYLNISDQSFEYD